MSNQEWPSTNWADVILSVVRWTGFLGFVALCIYAVKVN